MVINGVQSHWGAVKSIVPQVSVLGPLLFFIYVSQFKVLHFGHNNKQQHYSMKDSKLSTTKEEKDLGVLINDNLKPS